MYRNNQRQNTKVCTLAAVKSRYHTFEPSTICGKLRRFQTTVRQIRLLSKIEATLRTFNTLWSGGRNVWVTFRSSAYDQQLCRWQFSHKQTLQHTFFQRSLFLPRCIYAGRSLRRQNVSIRLSVCPSHAWIVTKRKHLAKKSSIMTNRKSPTSFPMSLRWTCLRSNVCYTLTGVSRSSERLESGCQ